MRNSRLESLLPIRERWYCHYQIYRVTWTWEGWEGGYRVWIRTKDEKGGGGAVVQLLWDGNLVTRQGVLGILHTEHSR